MGINDTVLTGEIRDGDPRSFKKLYDKYHEKLYYLAVRYLKNKDLAKDAVQDTFLKLWDKRRGLDQSSSIEGLLFTMLRNHVLNMIRNENNRKKVIGEVIRSSRNRQGKNFVEEDVIYSEYEDLVEKALVKLTPGQREVFELRSTQGLSNAEAAEKRNVSEHTVKTQYYLGSKFVRDYLKKHGGVLLIILVLFMIP